MSSDISGIIQDHSFLQSNMLSIDPDDTRSNSSFRNYPRIVYRKANICKVPRAKGSISSASTSGISSLKSSGPSFSSTSSHSSNGSTNASVITGTAKQVKLDMSSRFRPNLPSPKSLRRKSATAAVLNSFKKAKDFTKAVASPMRKNRRCSSIYQRSTDNDSTTSFLVDRSESQSNPKDLFYRGK